MIVLLGDNKSGVQHVERKNLRGETAAGEYSWEGYDLWRNTLDTSCIPLRQYLLAGFGMTVIQRGPGWYNTAAAMSRKRPGFRVRVFEREDWLKGVGNRAALLFSGRSALKALELKVMQGEQGLMMYCELFVCEERCFWKQDLCVGGFWGEEGDSRSIGVPVGDMIQVERRVQ